MPRATAPAGAPSAPGPASSLTLRIRGAERALRPEEIGLITSCENYTEITLIEGGRSLVRRTMRQWLALLPAARFARVHRGLIVNLDHLGHLERLTPRAAYLRLPGPPTATLEVKRRHWPALRRRLELWRLHRQPAHSPLAGKSLAVLPFARFALSPEIETFCDGLSEELINILAQVSGLRVAARTSSFHFKNQNLPVPEIARQLGVDYVVEGSVRLSRRHVRITAQLINAADGFHLWSETYDHARGDLLATQDRIAAEIVRHLQLKLRPPPRPPTADPAARRLALEGRHYWNLRTAEGFARAAAAFAQALALDPDFAAAHAALADLAVVRAMYRLADGEADAAEDLARAQAAARRALALDPALGEPHAALGFASFHAGRFPEALAHFPRAFAANPNYASGYQFHAWTLAGTGRLDAALAAYDRSIALDPLNFINLDRLAAMLALAGRPADALDASERAAALRPDLFVGNLSQRAPILLALGRTAEAVAVAREVRRLPRPTPFRRNADADAIHVLHTTNHRAEAAAYAAELFAQLAPRNYLRGFIHAALGRHDEAWPDLVHTPPIMLPQLYWSPLWQGQRARPEFHALLRRLGRTAEFARATTVS